MTRRADAYEITVTNDETAGLLRRLDALGLGDGLVVRSAARRMSLTYDTLVKLLDAADCKATKELPTNVPLR